MFVYPGHYDIEAMLRLELLFGIVLLTWYDIRCFLVSNVSTVYTLLL